MTVTRTSLVDIFCFSGGLSVPLRGHLTDTSGLHSHVLEFARKEISCIMCHRRVVDIVAHVGFLNTSRVVRCPDLFWKIPGMSVI